MGGYIESQKLMLVAGKCELVDLRVANANSRVCFAYAESFSTASKQKKNTHLKVCVLFLVTRGRIELPLPP